MFTLKDIACEFGLKLNTLRYWLKKNTEDCENELKTYDEPEECQVLKVMVTYEI